MGRQRPANPSQEKKKKRQQHTQKGRKRFHLLQTQKRGWQRGPSEGRVSSAVGLQGSGWGSVEAGTPLPTAWPIRAKAQGRSGCRGFWFQRVPAEKQHMPVPRTLALAEAALLGLPTSADSSLISQYHGPTDKFLASQGRGQRPRAHRARGRPPAHLTHQDP